MYKRQIATYDNEPKYEVIQTDISNVAKIISDFTQVEQGNLLIDLPGKIDDNALGTILKAADIIICPFKSVSYTHLLPHSFAHYNQYQRKKLPLLKLLLPYL